MLRRLPLPACAALLAGTSLAPAWQEASMPPPLEVASDQRAEDHRTIRAAIADIKDRIRTRDEDRRREQEMRERTRRIITPWLSDPAVRRGLDELLGTIGR